MPQADLINALIRHWKLNPVGGVVLGILDGGVPPSSPNPDPILD